MAEIYNDVYSTGFNELDHPVCSWFINITQLTSSGMELRPPVKWTEYIVVGSKRGGWSDV